MFRPPLTGHGGRNRAECNNGTMRPELPLGGVAAPQRPPVISGSPSIDGTVVFASGWLTGIGTHSGACPSGTDERPSGSASRSGRRPCPRRIGTASRSGGAGSRDRRGGCQCGVGHGEAASDCVDGSPDAVQHLRELVRRELGETASSGQLVQPLVASVGLFPIEAPLFGVVEPARLTDP